MKVLLIHNQYKQAGGEDSVFRAESDLLSRHGHQVEQLLYDNSVIKTFFEKCMAGLKTIYNPDSAHALKIKIQDFDPDVIHVHNFLPLVSPSILFTAKKLGVPVVLTLHNYRLLCPSATLFFDGRIYEKSIHSIFPFDAIWKGVYRNSKIQTAVVALMTAMHNIIGTWKNKVDCYITLTQFAKEKFENSSLSISTDKLFVKPNFVSDFGRGALVRNDFFLFIGRLTEEKGIRTLLKAADSHNFKLTIIGDGPMRKMVEDSALQNSNICYLGFQSKSTVLEHLKKCRALIFPSIWYEGFPVTILEAFSTCTPVIASNLGGMKEIVRNRVNGLHFEPGNHQDLVSKIMEVTEKKEFAKNLSDNARLSYLDHYTPAKNYAKLVGIYNTLVGQRQQIKSKVIRYPILQLENV